jgi:hypothetical protein
MTNPSNPAGKRRKRNQRSTAPHGRLTQRDKAIVLAVQSYRALTTRQVEALFFSSPSRKTDQTNSRCIKRLRFLYDLNLLSRRELPQTLDEGRKSLLHGLGKDGVRLAATALGIDEEDLDWTPIKNLNGFFIDHLIASNNVRIAITLAALNNGWTVEKWLDEHTLRKTHMKDTVTITGPEGGTIDVAIVPDAYFCLTIGQDIYDFMVEIDRGTVTAQASKWGKRDWARKIAAYIAYFHSGKYQARYESESYRILTVTETEARLATLKKVTEQAKGKAWFWFTTFDRATPDQILTGRIWQVANRDGWHCLTS